MSSEESPEERTPDRSFPSAASTLSLSSPPSPASTFSLSSPGWEEMALVAAWVFGAYLRVWEIGAQVVMGGLAGVLFFDESLTFWLMAGIGLTLVGTRLLLAELVDDIGEDEAGRVAVGDHARVEWWIERLGGLPAGHERHPHDPAL